MLPAIVWDPVIEISLIVSPSTSSVLVYAAAVRAVPSYSFVSLAAVILSVLASIFRLPFKVTTLNCSVTSLPSSSFTTAVPLISLIVSTTFVLLGSLVVRPLTVYSLPLALKFSVSNPSALCSLPS